MGGIGEAGDQIEGTGDVYPLLLKFNMCMNLLGFVLKLASDLVMLRTASPNNLLVAAMLLVEAKDID